jgi:hypothetical protein
MEISIYRNDSLIKKALTKMGHSSEKCMIKSSTNIDRFDEEIALDEFESEYLKYCTTNKEFGGEYSGGMGSMVVSGREDLTAYNLYKTVSKNGGMEQVTNDQKWKCLFYNSMQKTNVSYVVRTFYKKYLYEFERYRRDRGAEDNVDYNYKFQIRENVMLESASKEMFYGIVKLRRNRGLNHYYIQFAGWAKDHSEWYCEDVLEPCYEIPKSAYKTKRKSRSSKTNNLINDPVLREKHCHITSNRLTLSGKNKEEENSLESDSEEAVDIKPIDNSIYEQYLDAHVYDGEVDLLKVDPRYDFRKPKTHRSDLGKDDLQHISNTSDNKNQSLYIPGIENHLKRTNCGVANHKEASEPTNLTKRFFRAHELKEISREELLNVQEFLKMLTADPNELTIDHNTYVFYWLFK